MRVLDVGCGALRVGYWLMPFLDPGCYFGIEPNREMLNMGLEELVEPEVIERAQPRFAHNDDFDFSGFGVSFDFVFARSIWTHASKAQISAMLESFAMTSTPGGVFLTSYHPASAWFRVGRRWPPVARLATRLPLVEMIRALAWLPAIRFSRGYEGKEWVGRSHESDQAGVVRHSVRWIAAEARRHGLTIKLMPYPIINDQYWLRIKLAGGHDRPRSGSTAP
jgi:SAM-dependent methyltransferase